MSIVCHYFLVLIGKLHQKSKLWWAHPTWILTVYFKTLARELSHFINTTSYMYTCTCMMTSEWCDSCLLACSNEVNVHAFSVALHGCRGTVHITVIHIGAVNSAWYDIQRWSLNQQTTTPRLQARPIPALQCCMMKSWEWDWEWG